MRFIPIHVKRISLFLLFVLSLINESVGSVIKKGRVGWTHEIDLLNKNGINIQWRNTKDTNEANWIEIKVSGKTTGYLGVGFTPTGGMKGADMIIGWIDSEGNANLKDFYGVSNGQPIEDPSQDYFLINGTQIGNWTTIVFKRKWETCDEEHDLTIIRDTMKLIWAMGESDPILNANGTLNMNWHGPDNRGIQNVHMIEPPIMFPFPDEAPELFPEVKEWTMVMDNNEIKGEPTVYFCKILKFPDLDVKHHMIGWKPVLTPETEKHVHHMTFYECYVPPSEGGTESLFEPHVSHPGGRCYTSAMPPEWSQRCDTFLFVWAKGSEGEMFPLHVGSALGERHGGATYFMFEVHYDNPGMETFVDSSGIKIFYTEQLRPQEGSVMMLGHRVTPFLMIPPKQESFTTRAICSAECTEMILPPTGINIITAMLHAHIYAKKIKLRHVRNGTEMAVIAQDNHYEFNYQQSRILSQEVKVLPGDELLVECEYATRESQRVVLGGLASTQEMCNAFIFYYPKIDLMQCVSQPEAGDFFKAFGVNEVQGNVLEKVKIPFDPKKLRGRDLKYDLPDYTVELQESGDGESFHSFYDYINITSPEELRGKSMGRLLKDIHWEREELGEQVEKSLRQGQHYAFCAGHGRKRHVLKNYKVLYPNKTLHHSSQTPSKCPRN